MMNEKEVLDANLMIERILTYGVNLGIMSLKESEDYLLDLCLFINKNKQFKAVYQDNKVIIETYGWDPILAVRIYIGTLQISPMSENSFFESFLSILGFISSKNVVKEFIDEIDLEGAEEESDKKDDSEFDWI